MAKPPWRGLLAKEANLDFNEVSAIHSGVSDLRKIFDQAKMRQQTGRGTLLFVDEIHRFSRAQQDSFLPHMESGTITLVGATTENPSFALNAALLSRAQVLVLERLDDAALELLLVRAEDYCDAKLPLSSPARETLCALADGDGRYLLNLAENLFADEEINAPLSAEALSEYCQQRAPIFDRAQEAHYNLASALQKSIRGSDVDAALYWAARMIVGGEDPKFLLRRLIVIASEDIGNADPQALPLAIAAAEAFERLGSPEGEIAIGQLVTYLATAPKSNRSYAAFKAAKALARASGSLAPPPHALNAPTKLMKELGYSEGYAYDHDDPNGCAGLNYFPAALERQTLYTPSNFGFDKEIAKRLKFWENLRARRNDQQ